MIDERFYEALGPVSVTDLAQAAGLSPPASHADRRVSALAANNGADGADLTFIEAGNAREAEALRAGACFAPAALRERIPASVAVIETEHPRHAFARVVGRLARLREIGPGAAIHPDAVIGENVVIAPGVVIGAGAVIGKDSRVGPNAVIHPGVQIGWRCQIGAGASIRCALAGEDVVIQPGAVIGETGFGLAPGPGGAIPTPHVGRVVIQSGVSIGANTCIDRGLFDDTVIGEGAQIDNLCHVGHNARIGRFAVMAAFAGISGTAEVGDGAMFGGRVGLSDHVRVGKGAKIAAGAAVLQDVPEGATYAGYPAKAINLWKREVAWLASQSQKRPDKDK